MKKGTKIGVGVAGALMLATAGLAPFAYAQSEELQETMKAFHESIHQAISDGDYDTWSQLMSDHATEQYQRMQEDITQETFDGLQQVQELRDAGDMEAARELAQELDLPMMGGRGHKGMGDGGKGMMVNNESAEILEAGDYDAWVTFMNEHEDIGKYKDLEVNEETFNTLVEIHNLHEAGDEEAAHNLMEELRS